MLVCLAGSGAHLPRKRDVLSLTSYDVYHLRAELVAGCSGRVSAQLLEDAAARLDRFARRSRVSVGRVMAPPHNMSALPAHDALVGAGFEALSTKLGWPEDWPQELASTAGLSIEGLGSVDPVGYVSSAGGVSRVHSIGTRWQSDDHLSCKGGQTVEVIIGNAFRDHPPRQPASAPLRAYARRAAVEARDRLRPIMR